MHQYPLKNRKTENDRSCSSPVTARLLAKLAHRSVDYAFFNNSNSKNSNHFEGFRSFIESTSPAWNQSRCAGLLHRWSDQRSSDIDKMTAASLALWFASPETAYRITLHFDEEYKNKGYEYTRDELKRQLRKHGITDFLAAFEVSRSQGKTKKWRLHCHAMTQIPPGTDITSVEQSLADRFLKNKIDRKELTAFGNKITHIDPIVHSPMERKGPEYWVTYTLKDVDFTQALLGWNTVHYISQPLVKSAKLVYDWMRNPKPGSFPIAQNRVVCIENRNTPACSSNATTLQEPTDVEIAQLLDDFANEPLPYDSAEEYDFASFDRLSAELAETMGVETLAANWNNAVDRWISDFESCLKCHAPQPVNHYSLALQPAPGSCTSKKAPIPALTSWSTKMEILSNNETEHLIADLYVCDPNYTREIVGSMEIFSGLHRQRGRITVIKEVFKGEGVVFPTPRPTLRLVKAI